MRTYVLAFLALLTAWLPASTDALAQSDPKRVDHRNSIAVVIGNSKYEHTTPVPYAHNDARAIQDYLVRRLGFRRDNIVLRLDLGRERMETLFGEPDRPDGELMDRVLDRRIENRGDVFVFYSGHGVPDPDAVRDDDRRAFLLPVDVRQDRIAAAAYPIDRLQKKLDVVRGNLPEGRNVVLMLDACFSGRTPNPKVAEGDASIFRFSRGSFTTRLGAPQAGLVRLVAATGDQVAYWDDKAKLGLFTSLFLKAVGGEADGVDFGNGDKSVEGDELARYLEERLPAEARLRHQRSQRPTLESLERFRWTLAAASGAPLAIPPAPVVAPPVAAPPTAQTGAPAGQPAAAAAATAAAALAASRAAADARDAAVPGVAIPPTVRPDATPKAPDLRPSERVRSAVPGKAIEPARRRAPVVARDEEEDDVEPAPPRRPRVRPAQAPRPAAEPSGGCRVINGVRFCG